MSKQRCDLIYKLIIALTVEYLFFFGMEAILPGVITGILNINIILAVIIGLVIVFSANKECLSQRSDSNNDKKWKYLLTGISLFVFVIFFVILSKVSLGLLLSYLIGSGIVVKLLYNNLIKV